MSEINDPKQQLTDSQQFVSALRGELVQTHEQLAQARQELKKDTCGEALCGHDHSTPHWELRCNTLEQQLAQARQEIWRKAIEVACLTDYGACASPLHMVEIDMKRLIVIHLKAQAEKERRHNDMQMEGR
jgi:hypothetical protein